MRLVALFPLSAACCYAAMQIMTRRLGTTERASTISFYSQVAFIVASVTMGLVAGDGRFAPDESAILVFLLRAWTVPSIADGALFLGIGALNGVAAYLMSQGYRVSVPAALAPFEYVALPMSVFWGVLVLRPLAGLGNLRRDGVGLRRRPVRAEPRKGPPAPRLRVSSWCSALRGQAGVDVADSRRKPRQGSGPARARR